MERCVESHREAGRKAEGVRARARALSGQVPPLPCWVTSARLMLLSVKWEREHPSPLGGSKLKLIAARRAEQSGQLREKIRFS